MFIQFDNGNLIPLMSNVDLFNNEELHIRIKLSNNYTTDDIRNFAINATKISVYNDTNDLVKEYTYFNKVISTSRIEQTDMADAYIYLITRRPPVDYDYLVAAKIIFGEEG